MPRSYRNISMYEKEILELISQGKSLREIGEKLGFTHKQMRNFKSRYNAKQRKLAAGKPSEPLHSRQSHKERARRNPHPESEAIWKRTEVAGG